MKSLDPKQRKNGFDYNLVIREGNVAIYRQVYSENLDYFEIFKVKIRPATIFKGKHFPKREVFPSDSFFGETAWSCRTLEKAMERFRGLVEKEKNGETWND